VQGVKFEPSSFKLTHEMVVLMGGRASQGYALFTALTVKAFLALRAHTDALVATVQLMLGTGLPSFKGEGTIRRLRERFAPGLSERAAAEFMMGVIRNAHENVRSTAYDEFQRVSAAPGPGPWVPSRLLTRQALQIQNGRLRRGPRGTPMLTPVSQGYHTSRAGGTTRHLLSEYTIANRSLSSRSCDGDVAEG
jgi:hypothetical protein